MRSRWVQCVSVWRHLLVRRQKAKTEQFDLYFHSVASEERLWLQKLLEVRIFCAIKVKG